MFDDQEMQPDETSDLTENTESAALPEPLDPWEEAGAQFEARQRKLPRLGYKPKKRHRSQILAELSQVAQERKHWDGLAWPRLTQEQRSAVDSQGNTTQDAFNPTFSGSRHEREWIITYLGPFYQDHLILDVLHPVKGGKEATVYCCRAHPATGLDLLAAKVYRPSIFRNLRNDTLYRQGREVLDQQGNLVRDRRRQLAMAKKTSFGQEVLHTSWLANEFQSLNLLHAAGADVPKPLVSNENAMLMTYLGEEGNPAPPLNRVRLEAAEARPLFDRLIHNVDLMLAHNLIHGDLSGYNVLYWQGQATIIDLPQAVNALKNPHAYALLERDLTRLCEYFSRYDVHANARTLARDLWRRNILLE